MSYEQQYKKYKNMYLDLKRNQTGGTKTNYDVIINELQNRCIESIGPKQIKNWLQDVYNRYHNEFRDLNLSGDNLQNIIQNIKSEMNRQNIKSEGDWQNIKSEMNWQNIHHEVCQKIKNNIIPELIKKRDLQQKFIDQLGQMFDENRIDVNNYIEFAKNNNMLGSSVNDIVSKYSTELNKAAQKIKTAADKNSKAMSYLNAFPPAFFQGNIQPNLVTNISGHPNSVTSVSGRPCLSPCAKHNDAFRGNYCSCKTDVYEYFLKKYDWDYCDKSKCEY